MLTAVSPQKELFDLSYQSGKEKLNLHLQVGRAFLYAAHYDAHNHQYVGLKHFDFGKKNLGWNENFEKLQKALSSFESEKFNSLQIAFTDTLYTLVPSAIFDENQLEAYLSFNHPIYNVGNYDLGFDRLLNHEIVVVYAIPAEPNKIVRSLFPQGNTHHFSTPLIDAFLMESKREKQLNLHIQEDRFEIMYQMKGKLHFFNSFPYHSVEDFLYYLLFVLEQLQIDRDQIETTLHGEFEKQSKLYEMLYRYIRHLKLGERPKQLKFSNVLSELPGQYYHLLFNQFLCE